MHHASRHLARFLLSGLIAASLASTAFAETLYTKKSGTKVHQDPSARSAVVETLGAGASVSVNKTEDKFHQVTTPSGKTGYVFKFKLGEEPPEKGGNLSGLTASNMKVSETSSSSSIRGLSEVSEKHAQNKGISQKDIQAVKNMEAFHVPDNAVDRFLQTRNLGEYQK